LAKRRLLDSGARELQRTRRTTYTAKTLQIVSNALVTIAIMAIGAIVILGLTDRLTNTLFLLFVGASFLLFLLLYPLSFLVPVRCHMPGRDAPMRRMWVKVHTFMWKLEYRCTVCGGGRWT
jgi:hypothetical protein